MGYVTLDGEMDIALALRTMVVLPEGSDLGTEGPRDQGLDLPQASSLKPQTWTVHIQTGAGIVADSVPDLEHKECVNKAAAMAKAVDVAEKAFG